MTRKIGALSVDLQAETAAFQQDLQKARQAVTQATARMERDLTGVTTGMGRLDTAMGGVAAGAGKLGAALAGLGLGAAAMGLAQMLRGALDAAGGLGEIAEQSGVSSDALQILTAAAAAAGVKAEELQIGLRQLTRRIAEAAEGNEVLYAAFGNLGIGLRAADGSLRSTESVLADIADRLAAAQDPADRARIAVSLLGEAGQKLLPVLSRGRAGLVEFETAARSAGLVLSGDVIGAADGAADKIGEVTLRFERLQQVVAAGLAPAILQGLEKIERVLDAIRTAADNPSVSNLLRLIAQGGGAALQIAPSVLPGGAGVQAIGRALSGVTGPTTAVQDAEARVAELERRLAESQGGGRAGSAARLEAQLTEARAALAALRPAAAPPQTFSPTPEPESDIPLPPPNPPPVPPGAGRAGGAGGAAQPQLAAYIEQLRQQAAAQRIEADLVTETASARASALAILEAESRARQDVERGLRASVDLTDSERVAIIAAASARAESADAERRATELRQEATRVTEAARTEEERRAAAIARLNELLAEGLITQDTYARSVESLGKAAQNAGQEWAQFGDIAGSAFEDAILEGKALRDVLQGLAKDMSRLVLRNAVSRPLGDAIGSFAGGGSGGGGGFSLASFFGSGATSDGSMDLAAGIPGLAMGGPAYAGQIYEVGERGRELFVPPTDGRIIPNHELQAASRRRGGGAEAAGGAPVVVNLNFTGSARDFGANSQQIAGQLAAAVKRGSR